MTKKQVEIYTVDSFTTSPFSGNPAGVCLFDKDDKIDDSLLSKIAKEMNLSETAFLFPIKENEYSLRWFTPTVEVPLCGHATLASAAVLFFEKKLNTDRIVFQTKSGELTVTLNQMSKKLQMNFPQGNPKKIQLDDEILSEICKALPLERDAIIDIWHCIPTRKLLVEVNSVSSIEKLQPNFRDLMHIDLKDYTSTLKGIIVTTNHVKDTKFGKYDFISRYFAPWNGINEDPVTGSAHTTLSVYWNSKLGKKKLLAFQASERGGEMGLELMEDGRVIIEGDAVIVMKGKMNLP